MKRCSVEEQAAVWFVMLQSTEKIEDEWLKFERWIAESQEHDVAFARIESAWARADSFRDAVNPNGFSLEATADRCGVQRSGFFHRIVRRKWSWVGAAAIAIGVLWVIRFD